MPWYKSGTVACTLNSTTVTGTGTAFAANARVGDAYLGPDGRWYEIANIASDTVLSILPGYLGATVAAGTYALAPMQGYVKDSADALRALVNQYGAKLAALGTTGNYDILPVNKGGTGGTTQAEALNGLGLKGGGNDLLIKSVGQRGAPVGYNVQGLYSGWNGNGLGDADFICNRGSGAGGFQFWSVNADNTASGPVMTYSYAGLLTVSTLSVTGAPIPIASGGTGGNSQGSARTALGLGTAQTPQFAGLELSGSAPTIDFHYNNDAADYNFRMANDASGQLWMSGDIAPRGILCKAGVNGTRGSPRYNFNWTGSAIDCWIDATYVGSVTLFTSDYRIKKFVKDVAVPSFLDRIDAYRIVTYEKKVFGDVFRGDGTVYQGLIAHEAQAVNPLAVSGEKDAYDADGQPIIQQLDPMALITDLMGAIKELRAELGVLKAAAISAAK
jgi:hypothetical protein